MSHSGKLKEADGGVPRVSMDYHFIGKDMRKLVRTLCWWWSMIIPKRSLPD